MTFARARASFHAETVRDVRPGLTRTRILLSALGHPDRVLPAVQITGTNGKGSVAALLTSALEAAGYRVGRFTSPHLRDERERIYITPAILSPRAFASAAAQLLPSLRALRRSGDPATTFEAWTALAALAFRQAKVDIAVLEVGMGGRLDATSAWEHVLVSVLTHVNLDHTRELGSDMLSIAKEKMAVARPGAPLVSAESIPRLRELLEAHAQRIGCPLAFAGSEARDSVRIAECRRIARGMEFDADVEGKPWTRIKVALAGDYQCTNAALAILALVRLAANKFKVAERHIREGFRKVSWPGRLEAASRRPLIYLDGAHNPEGAAAAARELLARHGKAHLVVGIMADKDIGGMVRELTPLARRVWTVKPPDARAASAEDLASWFKAIGVQAQPAATYLAALREATQAAGRKGVVAVLGSLYNIEPARAALKRLAIIK